MGTVHPLRPRVIRTLPCSPLSVADLVSQGKTAGEAWAEHLSMRAAHYDLTMQGQRDRFRAVVMATNLQAPLDELADVAAGYGAQVPDGATRIDALGIVADAFLGWYS